MTIELTLAIYHKNNVSFAPLERQPYSYTPTDMDRRSSLSFKTIDGKTAIELTITDSQLRELLKTSNG